MRKGFPISKALKFLLLLGVLLLAVFWALTDPQAEAPAAGAPSPHQVQTARKFLAAAKESRETQEPVALSLNANDLQAISAMITQRIAPDRLGLAISGDTLTLTVSREIGPRWVNATMRLRGKSEGLPPFQIQIGALKLPHKASRAVVDMARNRLAENPADLPSLDAVVQSMNIAGDQLDLVLSLPDPAAIDSALRPDALQVPPARVGAIYCALTKAQESEPGGLFTLQLQRALEASQPRPEEQGAALVALAMFTVDYRTAALVGGADEAAKACKTEPVTVTLQGRDDWAKHWALSAALTVTLGPDVALAMGEWKELADSDTAHIGADGTQPSGFSFSDVAADRSGYFIARRLTDPVYYRRTRQEVLAADAEQLLPLATAQRIAPMTGEEFARRYGDTNDARYQAEIRRIDAGLKAAWR